MLWYYGGDIIMYYGYGLFRTLVEPFWTSVLAILDTKCMSKISSNQRCKISWHFLSVKVYDKVFNNFQRCEILQKELRVFLWIGADNTWSW